MMQESGVQYLSRRVSSMSESATIKMAEMARQLKSRGANVIALSLGEPDFDTPAFIKQAAKEALDAGYTKYTPVPGFLELRKAIARKFEEENGLMFQPEQIVVSNGAKQCIANVCLALLDPGDEVIILSPYWVSYIEIVKMAEGVPVIVHAGIDQNFKPSASQIKGAITDRTRLLIFSSPCNPTGSVFSVKELQEMAVVLAQHPQVMILSDEIYEYINFTDRHDSIGAIPEIAGQVITVNGFSKGFAMTGWRLGYMGAPAWLSEACIKIQGQFTSGAAAFSQMAAVKALNADRSETLRMREAFLRRRDLIIAELSAIPGIQLNLPLGAFYIFPDVSAYFGRRFKGQPIANADDLALFLLEEAHVATVSGSAFGADDCIRISYAASEEDIVEACRRIGETVQSLE